MCYVPYMRSAILVPCLFFAAAVLGGCALRPAGTGPGPGTACPTGVAPCSTGRATSSIAVTADASPAPIPSAAASAVGAAQADLQRRLGLAGVADLVVRSVKAMDWPDTSLGCPDPERMYAQVITPGYLVVLGHAAKSYEYHTDAGERVVLCVEGRPAG
jgi:hypothetical protein